MGVSCNIFTIKNIEKSISKIYVFQSFRCISPLVIARELKLSEKKVFIRPICDKNFSLLCQEKV
jgi:hypothetical protein